MAVGTSLTSQQGTAIKKKHFCGFPILTSMIERRVRSRLHIQPLRQPVLYLVLLLLTIGEKNIKGLDRFPSVGSVLKSHACAASCIASRNRSIKKLETHIADKK